MEYMENKLYAADIAAAAEQTRHMEYFAGRRIWILGASGLIGSFLTDCLLYADRAGELDLHICAVGRSRERLERRFGPETARLRYVEQDVSTWETDARADVIIHGAGYAYPTAFRIRPVETMLANIRGLQNVMETAGRNEGCRVVYLSSGEAQEQIDHLTVRACYPMGKKAAETLCMAYRQEYGTDVVIVRPCHTFGPNVTDRDNRAAAQFIAKAAAGEDIVLHSAGEQRRSYAYVADCVSGILTAAACGQAGQLYGAASDEVCSIRQFAEMCAEAAGGQVVFRDADETERAEASPIREQIIDNTERKRLGWRPIFSLRSGIAHSIAVRRGMQGGMGSENARE